MSAGEQGAYGIGDGIFRPRADFSLGNSSPAGPTSSRLHCPVCAPTKVSNSAHWDVIEAPGPCASSVALMGESQAGAHGTADVFRAGR